MSTVEERVINGFNALTEHYGPEWQDAIDRETLDLKSTCNCILGQLEGDYWSVYEEHSVGDWSGDENNFTKWSYEHGFCAADVSSDDIVYLDGDVDSAYEELTRAWLNKIGD